MMDENYSARIRERREEIIERMDSALAVSGRSLNDATLVAVSKTVGVGEVIAAIDAGYRALVRTARRSSIASSRASRSSREFPRSDST